MTPIDTHIATKSPEQQDAMNRMREFLRTLLPNAEEVISYGMPAFKQKKVLVFYEAFSKHLGFYPTAGPIQAFEADLKASGLVYSKGAVQLPFAGNWPEELLEKMVQFRQQQVG
jgi:uncharacterized protein YdhG (YjbR/CyaY superfamily)